MPEETALVGWAEIARYLGWTKSKTLSRRQELKKYGIIFHTLVGKPPNRRKRVFTFPSLLLRWLMIKTSNGEII
jgi:hypothetical protein